MAAHIAHCCERDERFYPAAPCIDTNSISVMAVYHTQIAKMDDAAFVPVAAVVFIYGKSYMVYQYRVLDWMFQFAVIHFRSIGGKP